MSKTKTAANAFIDLVTPNKPKSSPLVAAKEAHTQQTRMGDVGFDPRYDERILEQQRLNDLTTTVDRQASQEIPSVYLPDYEGYGYVSSMADRSAGGGMLVDINGVPLNRPVDLQGGQSYMFENPGQVWASASDPVRAIMMQAAAARALTGKDPLYLPWRMAPTGSDFATMTGETMLSFANANMGGDAKKALNAKIKEFIPDWKGVDDPKSVDQFRSTPDAKRKAIHAMMDKNFRNEGGLGIGEARLSIADPQQLNAPEGYLMNVGRIFADQPIIQQSGHPSYPKGVPGEGIGRIADDRSLFELNPKVFPVDKDIRSLLADPSTARSAYENLPDVVTARGIDDPRKPSFNDTRALQMKPYYGILTEKILRGMGYAEGGAVHKADGGMVDSVPEEAIKNTVRDPQAARLLDLDLAKYALMNQPQRMAGGGTMKKIAKAVTKPAALSQAEKDANLKQWMSSGKIRTDEGDPLRLYHATPKNFDQFKAGGDDPTMSGVATWLTDRADYQPAAHNIGGGQRGFKEGTNVMPVYSNASRPLLIDDPEMQQWANDVFAGGKDELPYMVSPNTAKAIKEAGYDYIHYADPHKSNEPHEYIMLDPERQIKSAIGNRGTYDPNEPSITKAHGGAVRMAQGGQVMAEAIGGQVQTPIQGDMGKMSFDQYRTSIGMHEGGRHMAEGGQAAAQISGDQFHRAANNEGLPTDNGSLNRIVDLVNAGMSLEQAAAEVRRKKPKMADGGQMSFNPQGADYDYQTARAHGMGQDGGNWGSVAPTSDDERTLHGLPEDSYVMLKGAEHPTWHKAVEAEEARGSKVVKHGDRYYSVPHKAEGGQVQRFDGGGEVSQDQMRYELANSPVMQATPRSFMQDALGTVGGYMDKAGRFVSDALEPIAESHPRQHFIANMLLADPLKGAGTALQDYTGTVRETDEDNPVRGVISKDWKNLTTSREPMLDPRVLDVAQFAAPVVKGITKLGEAGAKAITPFAKSTAEMAAELYGSGKMPGMVAPNAYMAEPSAPKPERVLAPANEQGFYSPTEAAALNLQRKTGNGQAFLNDLLKQKNVRPDEIKAMGVDTFLKDKKNVTAAEVQDYIAQNKLGLGESVYGDKPKPNFLEFLKQKGFADDEALKILNKAEDGNIDSQVAPLRDEYLNLENKSTKFKQWSLPGGENYREVVITTPIENQDALHAAQTKAGDLRRQTGDLMEQWKNLSNVSKPGDPAVLEAYQKVADSRKLMNEAEAEADALRTTASNKTYRSSHYDEPNILAHLRMSDRVTDGKKTLLVDEVQSDWHQAGRERGYNSPDPIKKNPDGTYTLTKPDGTQIEMPARTDIEMFRRAAALDTGVPDAPYKDDWYQLALRRAVKEAIDGGYDRVALPTGDRVNERFSLTKYIDRIAHKKNADGTYSLAAVDKEGRTALNDKSVPQDKLAGIVGKEVAQKIIDAEGKGYPKGSVSEDMLILSGLDLKVGGEGNRKYYDEIYPNYLKKFGKKYGASVGMTTTNDPARITGGNVPAQYLNEPLHYMDITPAMRKEFSTGIHMAKGGKVSFAKSADDMRKELLRNKHG